MRKLKKTFADFLQKYNHVTLPRLEASGYVPNVINKREVLALSTSAFTTGPRARIARILDDTMDGQGAYNVPVRIFNPNPERELPVMIFFHGGGGVAGSVTVYDPILRNLAVKTDHIVVAPEYSLAPERPYPLAEIDAKTVLYGAFPLLERRGVKFQKSICFGGDSGGGMLAAALAREIQHETALPIAGMFLLYPCLDFTLSFLSAKEEINGKGYMLQREDIEWYYDQYFTQGGNRYEASPIFGEMTSGLPRALIITSEFCPLRDEGRAYREKLEQLGVETEYHNMENMVHAFLNMEDLAKEETSFVYAKIKDFFDRSYKDRDL